MAYLNVDSAASGPRFAVSAVPALNPLLEEVALIVRDPASRLTIAARARDRLAAERGTRPTGSSGDLVDNRLGCGSDYTVFLNFLGVPVADLSFEGPYGVYHSIYDNHHWVARIGDPGFRYHVTMVQMWGLVTLRLADADVIPLDYEPYARRIDEFAGEVGRRWTDRQARASADLLRGRTAGGSRDAEAARRVNERRARALEPFDRPEVERLNRILISVERALLDPDGIPGRPWYRHLIYAPKFTYAPEVLPAVAEAVDAR